MGYWDKKEVRLKPVEEEQQEIEKPKKKEEYGELDQQALVEFENEANASARGVLEGVRELAGDIARQKKDAKDLLSSNYWCALVFNNTTQKHQFLANLGYDPKWTFIPGKSFAKKIGVSIDEPDHAYRERSVQKSFQSRAREIETDE